MYLCGDLDMKPITDFQQLDLTKSYTYADYLTWQFQERVELILGKIFMMPPAPGSKHQHIVSVLNSTIFNYLKGKPCRVFPSPFDVILQINGDTNTVIQPDITVVCDPSKLTEKGCTGSPDLVVEVLSKSSVTRDLHEKYNICEQAGVKEYWIVHPTEKTLIVFYLNEEGKYVPTKPLTTGDVVQSKVLPGLSLDLTEVFEDIVKEPEEDYSTYHRIPFN
jgi:Uma2 family endonuclease